MLAAKLTYYQAFTSCDFDNSSLLGGVRDLD